MIHPNPKTLPVEMLNHKSNSEPPQLKFCHDRATKMLVETSDLKVANHY
jgi:hypothetical protein